MINNLRQLDFNLLKALLMLLEEQNVSRAAQKMAMTQSAMSNALARLRECFADPLFVRTQYGISPTARAAALHEPLKRIMADLAELYESPEFDPATAEMTLRIGATDYGVYAVGLPFAAKLKQLAPKIKVAFLPIVAGNAAAELNKGALDFALVTEAETLPDFHTAKLFDEHYACAMRPDHPLSGKLDLDAYCAAEHLLVSYQGGQFAGLADTALATLGRSRNVAMSVNHFLAVAPILCQTDLIATVPSRLLSGSPDLHTCPPPLALPSFTKLLAWHGRTHHSAAFGWLRKLMMGVV